MLSLMLIVMGIFLAGCGFLFSKTEARDDHRQFLKAAEVSNPSSNLLTPAEEEETESSVWSEIKAPEKRSGCNANRIEKANNLRKRFIRQSEINNIDIRQGVNWNGKNVDILAGSNLSNNTIDIFIIGENDVLNSVPDYQISLERFIAWGFCLYKTEADELFAFVNNKKGEMLQLAIEMDEDGALGSRVTCTMSLKSQSAELLADDLNHQLYIGTAVVDIADFKLKRAVKTDPKI